MPREDVEMGNDEDEEPRAERNNKMKIQDMRFSEFGVLLVSKVEEVVDNINLKCRMKRRERTTPIVALDYGFSTQRNADTFPTLIFVDTAGMVELKRYVMNGKFPHHTLFHFLLVSSKILVFAESFSNETMNQARNHFQMW